MRADTSDISHSLPPVAVGGVGGSGTRLVAGILQSIGIFTGSDLNSSNDTLWFTLLFKREEILYCDEDEFDFLTRMLVSGLCGEAGPCEDGTISRLEALAVADRPQHAANWLKQRVESLTHALSVRRQMARWGWKEPNTHIVIERLWRRLPRLRYVHVVRHGIDMAYSQNQNQLHLWGKHVLGSEGEITPRRSLAYWCSIHRRMQCLTAKNPTQSLWLDYDALCRNPKPELRKLLEFLGYSRDLADEIEIDIKVPPQRYLDADLDEFAPEDIEFVESLGYPLR
ncbi:sulfotransferase [Pseudoxanthomonas wuyuanensis]|uniref:Sulfotransferase family protein n=1 Tax=Pseudoxanthomonas wuyuanensis TaxID=1073196 RepID=A0A286DGH9_9GAMM|nr:sulfotransferase [Pseudoxanthomonas wuyuanensis]SOD57700.1 Sulfotransferase family protein [Pseudoxanthomonas wuyuanensis]